MAHRMWGDDVILDRQAEAEGGIASNLSRAKALCAQLEACWSADLSARTDSSIGGIGVFLSGTTVVDFLPLSPAFHGGLRVGDKILKVVSVRARVACEMLSVSPLFDKAVRLVIRFRAFSCRSHAWQVDGVSVDSKSVPNALRGAHGSLVEVEVGRRPHPSTSQAEASSLGALFFDDAQALHVVQIARMSEDGQSEDGDTAEVEAASADRQARDRHQSLKEAKALRVLHRVQTESRVTLRELSRALEAAHKICLSGSWSPHTPGYATSTTRPTPYSQTKRASTGGYLESMSVSSPAGTSPSLSVKGMANVLELERQNRQLERQLNACKAQLAQAQRQAQRLVADNTKAVEACRLAAASASLLQNLQLLEAQARDDASHSENGEEGGDTESEGVGALSEGRAGEDQDEPRVTPTTIFSSRSPQLGLGSQEVAPGGGRFLSPGARENRDGGDDGEGESVREDLRLSRTILLDDAVVITSATRRDASAFLGDPASDPQLGVEGSVELALERLQVLRSSGRYGKHLGRRFAAKLEEASKLAEVVCVKLLRSHFPASPSRQTSPTSRSPGPGAPLWSGTASFRGSFRGADLRRKKTTVGIFFSKQQHECVIESCVSMLIGAPPHEVGLVQKGDVILKVDGLPVTRDTIAIALTGR